MVTYQHSKRIYTPNYNPKSRHFMVNTPVHLYTLMEIPLTKPLNITLAIIQPKSNIPLYQSIHHIKPNQLLYPFI